MECKKKNSFRIIQVFGEEYLGRPTQADVDHLLHVKQAPDLSGMLGSIDCMY